MGNKTLLIVGHPHFSSKSRVSALIVEQLNKNNINQVLILEDEFDDKTNTFNNETTMQALTQHDEIILLFPIWWYAVPARMKQWMDEPLSTFFFTKGKTNKKFSFIITCGLSQTTYSPEIAGTIETIIHPIVQVYKYLGWTHNQTLTLYSTKKSSDETIIDFTNQVNDALLK